MCTSDAIRLYEGVETHRPPQTYFFTSQTPVTALIRRMATTTTAMTAVFGDEVSAC